MQRLVVMRCAGLVTAFLLRIPRVNFIVVMFFVVPPVRLRVQHCTVNVGIGSILLKSIHSQTTSHVTNGCHQVLVGLWSCCNLVLNLPPVVVIVFRRAHVDEFESAPLAHGDLAGHAFDVNPRVTLQRLHVSHAPNVLTVNWNGWNFSDESGLCKKVHVRVLSSVASPKWSNIGKLMCVSVPAELWVFRVHEHQLLRVCKSHNILCGDVRRGAEVAVFGILQIVHAVCVVALLISLE